METSSDVSTSKICPPSYNGIEKYMDCSLYHLSWEDYRKLKSRSTSSSDGKWVNNLIIHRYEHGYWIFAPQEEEDLKDLMRIAHFPDSLLEILTLAYHHKCVWVKLDEDGFDHPDLVTYKW